MMRWIGSAWKLGWRLFRRHGVAFAAGVAVCLAAYLAIGFAMEPVSRSEYCGGACHEMNVSYQSWEISRHGHNPSGNRTDCIDCHLPPREQFIRHAVAKGYAGAKDLYMHKFGPEYDRDAMRKEVLSEMANKTCLHCHDNLLARARSTALESHRSSIANPEVEEFRCVKCHEDAGHIRNSALFPIDSKLNSQ
jgi:nitrate/TMAO reductase-like tetraheme cytochrome c subunit